MFTGLIEEVGIVRSITSLGGGKRLRVAANKITEELKIDDSVAISGVCLTVVASTTNSFDLEIVEETFRKSKLNELNTGSEVNLERAMRLSDRLGGHIVQGHVDTVGSVDKIIEERTGILLWINFDSKYQKYIIPVGSICVDGVSLTVAEISGKKFKVSIIPHTWKVTTLRNLKPGSRVNLEFDLIGKYVEKMLASRIDQSADLPKKKSSILDKYLDQPDW